MERVPASGPEAESLALIGAFLDGFMIVKSFFEFELPQRGA
jgi:hypothetical protein